MLFGVLIEACENTVEPTHQLQVKRGLARAYGNLQNADQMLAVAEQINAEHPRSIEAAFLRSDALRALGRSEEIVELAEKRHAASNTDVWALHVLASQDIGAGRSEKAASYVQQLAGAQKLPMRVALHSGWSSLGRRAITPETLRELLRSIQRVLGEAPFVRSEDSDLLREVATLHAELGELDEARAAIASSLQLRFRPVLTADDEFVIGRIAEQYGLLNVARATYAGILEDDAATDGPRRSLVRRQLAIVCDALGNWWGARGDYKSALDEFNTAIELDPENPSGFFNRGRVWCGDRDDKIGRAHL